MRFIPLLIVAAGACYGARSLPVAFEPNQGQYPAKSDFVARGDGYAVSIAADRAEFRARGGRFSMVLEGARTSAPAEAESKLPGVVNYLHGRDSSAWITGLPTYERVRYRGVYPGIDLVYYGNGGAVEYDFVLSAGADPKAIRIRYEGADSVRVDSDGDLVIQSQGTAIRQHRPVVYQEVAGRRRLIEGRYIVRGRRAQFALTRYDRTRPLIIDPSLTWATLVGYPNSDTGEAVALDSAGNSYITGATMTPYGDNDVLIWKISPDGSTALIKTYFGGSYDDAGHAIAVDSSGNIYIAGQTDSPDFPYSGAALSVPPGYSWDTFVIKLNSAISAYAYSDLLGGSGDDIATGIAIDSSGDAFVAGYTNSTDFPVTQGAPQSTSGGAHDGFVFSIGASGGSFGYSTYLGGSGDDYAFAIALDGSGNAFVTGSTTSTNFPVTAGVLQSQSGGAIDAFVAKLASSSGSISLATYLGGNGNDYGYGIAVDSSGIYVAGETASVNFPVVKPAQKAFAGGTGDAFAAKLDPNATTLLYSTYLGGTGEDAAYALAVDGAGNAYLAGFSSSTDLPLSNAFQNSNQGPTNALLAGLDGNGALLFSSYLGGNGKSSSSATVAGDYANGAAINCAAGLVVAGTTSSANFPASSGAALAAYQGGPSDAFLARIAMNTSVPSISAGGVVNGANFASGPVAPGSLIAIYGTNLASSTQQPAATPLPVSLAGATVQINGTPAPIFFTSSGQMNVQVPYETAPGSAALTIGGACGSSTPVSFQVAPAAPYLFAGASGDALAFNQDGSLNSASNGAKAGSVITVYLTGIGAVNNAVATGAAASGNPLSGASLPNSATIGGSNAGVYYLGLTPATVSIAQANLYVPTLAPGKYPVIVTVNGVASNGPNVYVK